MNKLFIILAFMLVNLAVNAQCVTIENIGINNKPYVKYWILQDRIESNFRDGAFKYVEFVNESKFGMLSTYLSEHRPKGVADNNSSLFGSYRISTDRVSYVLSGSDASFDFFSEFISFLKSNGEQQLATELESGVLRRVK